MFKDFKDIKDYEAYENESLAHHGQLVMAAIDEIITNMHDVDTVLARLEEVGDSHKKFAGFTSDLFYVSVAKPA